ncbi:hypothetical protein [Variovorax sp. AFSI2.2]|uniref:hypothetical protein n=1 Tax=Variovorax sp. AFSI2.2 TaxID=3384160 RepID=UPI003EB6A5A0
MDTLTSFSNIARDLAALNQDGRANPNGGAPQSVFAMPSFPTTVGNNIPRSFDFHSMRRMDRGLERLQRDWLFQSLRPHMLRRAYALIFHYRYENATLQALSQQLQHQDIENTRVYVSDSAGTAVADTGVSLYGRLTPAQRNQIETDRDSLDVDLKDVANEKLMLFVQSVVGGRATFSGGYARLVQRFHQQLGRSISYSALDLRERAKQLGKTLISRGHEPRPMAHGTCMAGTSVSRLRGHCFDIDSGALDRSNANPTKCARCPYHVVTQQHLCALQAEYDQAELELRKNSDQPSLQRVRRIADLALLRKLIELHARRLAQLSYVNEADSSSKNSQCQTGDR